MWKEDIFMRKKIGAAVAAAGLLALILACRAAGTFLLEKMEEGQNAKDTAAGVAGDSKGNGNSGADGQIVLLDPGHGGIDGGKVGTNGAEEKDVNLQISLILKELLEQENIPVLMTRTEDERLGTTQVEDLKERVNIMNSKKPVLSVSIHQNSYHEESVHGAQTFYYTDSQEGKKAAEIIQSALKEIDPENTKQAKANSTYYILKKTEVPVVIVECGFLSNYEEAENLTDEEYQKKLAQAVANGIRQYINER